VCSRPYGAEKNFQSHENKDKGKNESKHEAARTTNEKVSSCPICYLGSNQLQSTKSKIVFLQAMVMYTSLISYSWSDALLLVTRLLESANSCSSRAIFGQFSDGTQQVLRNRGCQSDWVGYRSKWSNKKMPRPDRSSNSCMHAFLSVPVAMRQRMRPIEYFAGRSRLHLAPSEFQNQTNHVSTHRWMHQCTYPVPDPRNPVWRACYKLQRC
jgi:hypothetical protein